MTRRSLQDDPGKLGVLSVLSGEVLFHDKLDSQGCCRTTHRKANVESVFGGRVDLTGGTISHGAEKDDSFAIGKLLADGRSAFFLPPSVSPVHLDSQYIARPQRRPV